MGLISRRAPTAWNDLDFSGWDTPNNPFNAFSTWFTALGFDANAALIWFTYDYEEALTEYSENDIGIIMSTVAQTNAKKYDKLIAAYIAQYDPLDEYSDIDGYTDTRTPDLTTNSTGGATVGTTIKRNQTRTDTETPNNYTNTIENQKAPYDSQTYKAETKSTSTASGSRSTSVAYTGQADETNSTSTTSNLTTNTGTETIVHDGSSSGRKRSPAQLLDEELALAEKMNIFKIIERDIAAKIFIAVWPTY